MATRSCSFSLLAVFALSLSADGQVHPIHGSPPAWLSNYEHQYVSVEERERVARDLITCAYISWIVEERKGEAAERMFPAKDYVEFATHIMDRIKEGSDGDLNNSGPSWTDEDYIEMLRRTDLRLLFMSDKERDRLPTRCLITLVNRMLAFKEPGLAITVHEQWWGTPYVPLADESAIISDGTGEVVDILNQWEEEERYSILKNHFVFPFALGVSVALHLALSGAALFHVWKRTTGEKWASLETRLVFQTTFWTRFLLLYVPGALLATWIFSLADGAPWGKWLAGAGAGLLLALVGRAVIARLHIFRSGAGGEVSRVGPIQPSPPTPRRSAPPAPDDHGFSNDW